MKNIKIIGARENNLKNIDLEVPRGKLVVITGISGSGKSSIAFDTIFAEGQRRYIESLSSYARQFVEQIDKPDIDSIEGLSPSISVDQKGFHRNPRSTVGTTTEIYDFLRLLFARLGTPYCYNCGDEISAQTLESMNNSIKNFAETDNIQIYSPIVRGRKGEHRKELEELREEGFLKVKVDGELLDLDDEIILAKQKKHTIEILIDVISFKSSPNNERIKESTTLALKRSGGLIRVEKENGKSIILSEQFACGRCGISYPEISPRLFSFNSPYGACKSCEGLGNISYFDPELMIGDPEKSIEEGALIPVQNSSNFRRLIKNICDHFDISISVPINRLPKKKIDIIFHGKDKKNLNNETYWDYEELEFFPGIVGIISKWFKETSSEEVRENLSRYMISTNCKECNGSRLRKESTSILFQEKSIHEITIMSVKECSEFFKNISLKGNSKIIGDLILKEINSRLEFLEEVGLDYLTLNRSAPSLSGGESQRIRLATQVGSKLTGITYVLDEPTIGLHRRDNRRLMNALRALKEKGNTIIVVEHDEEMINDSDYIIDVGPGAGELGGEIVGKGTICDFKKKAKSITAKYLSGILNIPIPRKKRKTRSFIEIKGASENNLKDIDVSFPLGVFTCVTGVSGSGKSTLVIDTLYKALTRTLYKSKQKVGQYIEISGIEYINKAVNVEQSPIGRTPRSNPATYTGMFANIRELFSMLPESRARGYKPGRFSFNVKDGRCSSCKGDGTVKIEMHFLPDVYVKCEICNTKRYNPETLEIKYKGKSISDVLEMTVSEAAIFFDKIPHIKSKLDVLNEVGMGYIKLGQSATTFSGGEAQRIKLSKELARRQTGKTLYILDEPTIGLHFDDVKKLLFVIQKLVDQGNTVIVIEHNLDVIKTADHVIDLGPEGGEEGGHVVEVGTPERISKSSSSYTGRYLKEIFSQNRLKLQ